MTECSEILHDHCRSCHRIRCDFDIVQDVSCVMVWCGWDCGAKYHSCKQDDHAVICPERPMPCIMTQYGCPHIIKRIMLAKHLVVCPANVMLCSMEWNRWANGNGAANVAVNKLAKEISTKEICKSRLDLVWAMRDQKMYIQKTFPIETLKKLYAISSCNPSIKENLINEPEMLEEKLVNDYKDKTRPHEENVEEINGEDTTTNEKDDAKKTKNRWSLKFHNFNWNLRQKLFSDKCVGTDETFGLDPLLVLSPEAHPHTSTHVDRLFSLVGVGCRERPEVLDSYSPRPYSWNSSTQTDGSYFGYFNKKIDLMRREHTKTPTSTIHDMNEDSFYESVNLDLMPENRPRYQTKPRLLHTFMCNCVLHREEYTAHVKNVHCEITSRISHWLEEKCPFSQFGCPFVRNNLCPGRNGNRVAFNRALDCFCILPKYHKELNNIGELSIFDLPVDAQRVMLTYLDSLALQALSQTCTYFYDLCINDSLSRQVVTFNWHHRKYNDGSTSWKMGEEIWLFSHGIGAVDKWHLSSKPIMACHIERCEFATEAVDKEKYNLKRYPIICGK